MKKPLLLTLLALVGQVSMAQTSVTVAVNAYGPPRIIYIPTGVSLTGQGTESLVLEMKTTQPVNCGGNTTSRLKFITQNNRVSSEATYTNTAPANQSFIMISELINAAKNNYMLEIPTAALVWYNNVCWVTENDGGYFIRIN